MIATRNFFAVLFLSTSLILASCSGKQGGGDSELEKLKTENEQLKKEIEGRDQTVDEFMKSFNDIENDLISIQGKEKSLTENKIQNSAEINGDTKARIEAEIQSINEMMEANKKKISDLKSRIKKSNLKIKEFEKTIERLSANLAEKDAEIASLNEKLIALNYQVEDLSKKVETLETDNQAKDQMITQKTDELNIAYYAVGTKKELIANGVLSKDGSFSGGKKMNVNYDAGYFTKIDVRQKTEINVGGKKAKLLSSHPTSSYELTGDKLTIKDAGAFWKASKYCVVEVIK
jgi:chromosome segregation ATPase